jgi:serine/threonine protein kinase
MDCYDIIGHGKEGDVYISKDKRYVLKVYKPPLKLDKIKDEINFLSAFRYTSAVPKIERYTDDSILMEYLDGYITLKKFAKIKKNYTIEQLNYLLLNILKTRLVIGENIFYRDMHLDNILVNPDTLDIKFIDQGMSECQDYGWLLNMKKIVEDLKMSRNPIGKLIIKNNKEELSKLLYNC